MRSKPSRTGVTLYAWSVEDRKRRVPSASTSPCCPQRASARARTALWEVGGASGRRRMGAPRWSGRRDSPPLASQSAVFTRDPKDDARFGDRRPGRGGTRCDGKRLGGGKWVGNGEGVRVA